jgi:hypothetical protein
MSGPNLERNTSQNKSKIIYKTYKTLGGILNNPVARTFFYLCVRHEEDTLNIESLACLMEFTILASLCHISFLHTFARQKIQRLLLYLVKGDHRPEEREREREALWKGK